MKKASKKITGGKIVRRRCIRKIVVMVMLVETVATMLLPKEGADRYLGSRSEKADFAVFMYSRLLVRFVGVTDRIFSRLHSGSVQAKMVTATFKDLEVQLSIVGPYLSTKKTK
jgi:hypothetical protein